MATPSPFLNQRIAELQHWRPNFVGREGSAMFPKLVIIAVIGVFAWFYEPTRSAAIPIALAALVVVYLLEAVRIVPQQYAWVVEKLGRYDRTLEPGLRFIFPPFEKVAYKHSLKEIPLDVAEQTCITRDNTQLAVDGIIYFQVTDPRLASLRHLGLHLGDHADRTDDPALRGRQDGARSHLGVARHHQSLDRLGAG